MQDIDQQAPQIASLLQIDFNFSGHLKSQEITVDLPRHCHSFDSSNVVEKREIIISDLGTFGGNTVCWLVKLWRDLKVAWEPVHRHCRYTLDENERLHGRESM